MGFKFSIRKESGKEQVIVLQKIGFKSATPVVKAVSSKDGSFILCIDENGIIYTSEDYRQDVYDFVGWSLSQIPEIATCLGKLGAITEADVKATIKHHVDYCSQVTKRMHADSLREAAELLNIHLTDSQQSLLKQAESLTKEKL